MSESYLPPAPGFGPREGESIDIDYMPHTLHEVGHNWKYMGGFIRWRDAEGIEEELAYPKMIGGSTHRVYSDGLRFYCAHCLQVVTLWTQRPPRDGVK